MSYSNIIEISPEDFEQEKANAGSRPVSGGPRVVEISPEEFEAEKKGLQKQRKNLAQPGNARSSLAVEAEENISQFKQNVGDSLEHAYSKRLTY